MYGESNCCGKDFRRVFEAATYIRKYGGGGWRVVGVRKRPRKCFRSIRCGCEKGRNYHGTFASKGIASVFAVFATVRYYRMFSNRTQEIFS